MTIRLRLTLWYSGLLAATILVLGAAIYYIVQWNTYSTVKQQLVEHDRSLDITGTAIFNQSDWKIDLNVSRNTFKDEKDIFIQLINYREGVIARSNNIVRQNFDLPYPEQSDNQAVGFKKVKVDINKQKFSMLIHQRPIPFQGETIGLLQIAAFTYNEEQVLSNLRTIFIIASLAMLMIAFTLGLVIAHQALRPIERVIQATRQIEKGSDLSMRIPYTGPKDELNALVHTLNTMLSRLEVAYNELDEAYKAQRRFVSDASHELRTPLTTIRGNIDLLQKMAEKVQDESKQQLQEAAGDGSYWLMSKEAMDDISAEAKRMSHLVNDLLALARADAGYVMQKQHIFLFPLVEEVIRRAQLLPHTVEWKASKLDLLHQVKVYGNYEYLQQLLFVFIENAFKYTQEGSVELSVIRGEKQIGIVIADTGIGMNSDEIPYVFDRFYRADESRGETPGTGLGLSIAKWIIDEHKGSVEVVSGEGKGTIFTIWLPIAYAELDASSIIEETTD
ncbi:sensor histidine kinase [Paenibacillus yanchengensis]|uniref:histidine kinase n=1 Tax=Paenibacillus yanchengensis TaxID=2035833 RepID=A0ABW4YPQ3_9BACL